MLSAARGFSALTELLCSEGADVSYVAPTGYPMRTMARMLPPKLCYLDLVLESMF